MRISGMKTLTAIAASVALVVLVSATARAEGENANEALTAQAHGIVAKFGDKLKGELMGAIKAEGPVKAIEVCNVSAPAIAAEVSTEGWSVRRTSFKLRNAKAKPDAWEYADARILRR